MNYSILQKELLFLCHNCYFNNLDHHLKHKHFCLTNQFAHNLLEKIKVSNELDFIIDILVELILKNYSFSKNCYFFPFNRFNANYYLNSYINYKLTLLLKTKRKIKSFKSKNLIIILFSNQDYDLFAINYPNSTIIVIF